MKKEVITLAIPCLVDQVYPRIGVSMLAILEKLGFEVRYSPQAVCCGQPAFNSGQLEESRKVAIPFVEALSGQGTIVCPSGSCTAMVRNFYPELFAGHGLESKAKKLCSDTFEFFEFLSARPELDLIRGSYSELIGFHNSCHSERELRQKGQVLKVLTKLEGGEIYEPAGEQVCCGFGGLFCLKFDSIAQGMARTRLEQFKDKGVTTLLTNDPGCIFHLEKESKRLKMQIKVRHALEFLADSMGLKGVLS